jgi:ribosomal protein S18 acetylase RimI-like enzyme
MPTIHIRPLGRADAGAAHELLASAVDSTPYGEAPLAALCAALAGESDETRGLVAVRGTEVLGAALYGDVAGAAGAGKVHAVVVARHARRQGVGTQLCAAVAAALRARGSRLVVAELPDDEVVAPLRALLTHVGFGEESRVSDFYRDGVALLVLRLDLASASGDERGPARDPSA